MAQRGGSNGLLPTHEKVPLHPFLRNRRIEVPRNLKNNRVFGRAKNPTLSLRNRSDAAGTGQIRQWFGKIL